MVSIMLILTLISMCVSITIRKVTIYIGITVTLIVYSVRIILTVIILIEIESRPVIPIFIIII